MNEPEVQTPVAPTASPDPLPKPSRWQKHRASQSFPTDEIDIVLRIFSTMQRGGDLTMLIRSDAARRVNTKFTRMKQKIERAKRLPT